MVLDKQQRSTVLQFTKQPDPLEGMVKVEEYVDVGTEKVLESPHVSEGPGRIANSPVPSIYVDDRGEIHRFRVGGTRINMLFSKKDVMRSGYLHNHKTFTFVIKGKVEMWLLEQEGTVKTVHGAGSFFQIDPFYPHILYFLEDSLILEHWEGQFQCWYYHPYRRLVQLQNELVANCHEEGVSSSIGQWQRLVPLDQGDGSSTTNSVVSSLIWLGTGMILGAVSATAMLLYAATLSKRKL